MNIDSPSTPSSTDSLLDRSSAQTRSTSARVVVPSAARPNPRASLALAVPVLAVFCAPAHAYVGPGAGLGVIGTLFGIGAAIVLAMFGLFWYPLKRAFGRKSAGAGAGTSGAASTGEPMPADAADPAAAPAPAAVTRSANDGDARPE